MDWIFGTASDCTDLTNLSTMTIELIIGIIGAISITGLFVRRENNRRNQRRKILTKRIIKETIIPLHREISGIIDYLTQEIKDKSYEEDSEPEGFANKWKDLMTWKNRIAPIFSVSGDVLSGEQQVLLSKILEDMDMKLNFEEPVDDLLPLRDFQNRLTKFLDMNKDLVKEDEWKKQFL